MSDSSPPVGRIEIRPGVHREQVVNEYWLTERQALKVIAKSETEVADQILDEVIAVFVAYRRGQLATPQQVPVLSSSPLLGDSQLRTEFAARCTTAATTLNVGIHRIHGAVRQQLRVVGIYQLPVLLYTYARELVDAWTAQRLPLPGGIAAAQGGKGRELAGDADEPAAREGAAVIVESGAAARLLGSVIGMEPHVLWLDVDEDAAREHRVVVRVPRVLGHSVALDPWAGADAEWAPCLPPEGP